MGRLVSLYKENIRKPEFREIIENQTPCKPSQKITGRVTSLLFGFQFLDIIAMTYTEDSNSSGFSCLVPPAAGHSMPKAPFDEETTKIVSTN